MPEPINNIESVILIKELPNKSSIGATDLYLSQTDTESFKITHEQFVNSIVDENTITIDPTTTKITLKPYSIDSTQIADGGIDINKLETIPDNRILGNTTGGGSVSEVVMELDLSTVNQNHDTVASAKGIKDYVDQQVSDISGGVLSFNSVTNLQLADNSVNTDEIVNGAVTIEKLASTVINSFLEKAYPLGSIYVNANTSTDPSTLLGIGEWEPFGEGKVMVGLDSNDTSFNTLRDTGGHKNVTLNGNQIPSHTHKVNPPSTDTNYGGSHSHEVKWDNGGNLSHTGNAIENGSSGNKNDSWSTDTVKSAGNHRHSVNIPEFDSSPSGSGASHTNVQPYIVVKMWRRIN